MLRAVILVTISTVARGDVLIPGGRIVNRECVHEVPSGTSIEETENEFRFTFPNGSISAVALCKNFMVSHGNAWKTWAQYRKSDSAKITSLKNQWTVPKGSFDKGSQILYYWNGIEDGGKSGGGSGVLQPVLEWRRSSGWGIKSWYVGSGGTVTSNLVSTPPGTVVTGSMSLQQDGTWICTGQPAGGSPATLHFTRKQPTFTTAYEVLEAYSVGSECGMYPSDGVVGFSNTEVAFDGEVVSDLTWETHSCPSGPGCAGSAECGERTTVDNGVVNIHFQSSSSHDVVV